MNQAGSHVADRRGSEEFYKMGGFYRQKEGETRKLKDWIISGKVTLF